MFRVFALVGAAALPLLAACRLVTPTPAPTATPVPAAFVGAYAESFLSWFGVVEVDSPTRLTRDEALSLGRDYLSSLWFLGRSEYLVDQLQALLVRYTADPSYFEYGKLSWFLVAPPTTMRLAPHGGPVRPPAEPDQPQTLYWPAIVVVMLDDETGLFWGGSLANMGFPGPSATPRQMTALNSYVATYGWWPVWFQLRQYDGRPIPESAILGLKPPDQLLAN